MSSIFTTNTLTKIETERIVDFSLENGNEHLDEYNRHILVEKLDNKFD